RRSDSSVRSPAQYLPRSWGQSTYPRRLSVRRIGQWVRPEGYRVADEVIKAGKTTYTQMVGLCQILAQTGVWVPAASARLSPVDNIYTHYPVEEQLTKGTGRFGDEAQRLYQIFARGTRHSLILLNESLASTNPGE